MPGRWLSSIDTYWAFSTVQGTSHPPTGRQTPTAESGWCSATPAAQGAWHSSRCPICRRPPGLRVRCRRCCPSTHPFPRSASCTSSTNERSTLARGCSLIDLTIQMSHSSCTRTWRDIRSASLWLKTDWHAVSVEQSNAACSWIDRIGVRSFDAAHLQGEATMSGFWSFVKSFGLLIARLGLGGILLLHGWLRWNAGVQTQIDYLTQF